VISTITHFHIFCGSGGGALGFQQGEARVGKLEARFQCLGGVDVDPAACRDFQRLVGVDATCLDLFGEDDYAAFHDRKPPPHWREATPDDLRGAAGKSPDILFFSAPCKGFSGLLSTEKAASPKYEALNRLALRSLLLALEAFSEDLPPLLLFENVPRMQQRGRQLLDRILGLLRHYGYAARETTHDAGEIGGLAQHRRRFLLVARHEKKVPAFLYEPGQRRVRSIGEELERLPPPNSAGPMHDLPRLTWATWLRLALIPAGKDWRALRGVDLGQYALARYGDYAGKMRVENWGDPGHTITTSDRVGSGGLSVADVRWGDYQQYGVLHLDKPAGTVTAQAAPGSGAFSIAAPIPATARYNNVYRLIRWGEPSACVSGGASPCSGGLSVADPRGASWANAGHYGVVKWDQSAGAVTAHAGHDNGRHNVADPRIPGGQPLIIALDNTWHRPLTTLELAALQGFPTEGLILDGKSHSAWRERIGNAVPPPAARAIAGVMGQVLLMARSGQTFALSSTPIWVRPLALALTVEGEEVYVQS
jgi:site-specific DNA-cytosine methylase